jgi:hypothetical protein
MCHVSDSNTIPLLTSALPSSYMRCITGYPHRNSSLFSSLSATTPPKFIRHIRREAATRLATPPEEWVCVPVTWIFSVIQFDRHNIIWYRTSFDNFTNTENVYKLQTLKTEQSKQIILCVSPSLVNPSTWTFNCMFSVIYCSQIRTFQLVQSPPPYRFSM